MFESYSDASDLDSVLSMNRDNHRSPIIYLPEILIYDYGMEDVLECANNFRECQLPKDDNPVNNTLEFYTDKFGKTIPQPVLNKILEIIIDNKYSIFHVNDDSIYLISLKPGAEVCVCQDKLTPNFESYITNCAADDLTQHWDDICITSNYNDFIHNLYNTIHSGNYKMSKNLIRLLKMNEDYMDNFNRQPAFEYAYNEEAFADGPWFDDSDRYDVFEPVTEARRQASPEENVANGLDSLERMSGKGQGNAEGEDVPQNMDNTRDARNSGADTINAEAEANERLKERGMPTTDDIKEENEENAGGDEEGAPEDGGEGEDAPADDTGDEPDDGADAEPEEPDTDKEIDDAIDDPNAKKKYKDRFVNLYKHISDTIDSLETFSPDYTLKFTDEYFAIQSNLHRLKAAIYKICTKKINDMSTVDVMKAYTTANYAYDTIAQMLKEFAKQYNRERKSVERKRRSYNDDN